MIEKPTHIPAGHILLQPNKTWATREECLICNPNVVKMWTDVETGRIACMVIIPTPKHVPVKQVKQCKDLNYRDRDPNADEGNLI